MKAQDLPLTQLLGGSKQFVIPIFQRTYSWDLKQCEQLWADIIRVGSTEALDSHFIGSAVYIPEAESSASLPRWMVIDGQQRITTITLLLLALQRKLEAGGLEDPVQPAFLDDTYLRNRYGRGDQKYKLLLTKTDRQAVIDLIDGKSPSDDSPRIVQNYAFFSDMVAKTNPSTVYNGICKLRIVDVQLQQGIDNPQMIFESMNSTGKALTQADLVRNFVLMGLEHDLQTQLYENHWRPMEEAFGAEHYVQHFDDFMRFVLVIETGNNRIRKNAVYEEFRAFSRDYQVTDLLKLIGQLAVIYCKIALGKEADPDLSAAFHDIRELRADVCYPLLMELYRDHETGDLSKAELLEATRLIESYVFRRAVCDIPTNSLRQTFARFTRKLKKDRYLESIKAQFLSLPSYRRFPDDEEFMRAFRARNLYSFNRRSYWLRRFENHDRKEMVPVNDYTIEHIMPQNVAVSTAWQEELGPDWERIHSEYLHTLGNLTLTGYNSEYSNRPFAEKRDMENGFRDSPLRMNKCLGSCVTWNEEAIVDRAKRLAESATDVWRSPSLPQDILAAYLVKGDQAPTYSIADHPHLEGGKIRELFERLRAIVLELDPCVAEEFTKLYVAYKAETNFVDVIPQASRLRLTLNIDYPDIDDPRGLCRDITNIGRWGNGNTEVVLDNLDDLHYVAGLIRQSFERQIGEAENGDS